MDVDEKDEDKPAAAAAAAARVPIEGGDDSKAHAPAEEAASKYKMYALMP
jgi:hypothetical protein